MKAKKVTKTAMGVTLAAALVATSLVIPATTQEAQAATDWDFTYPTTAMEIEQVDGKRVLTTMTQRAASEIPLIMGVNVMGGNAFNGLLYLAGTDVNENPDPYVWNYNYTLETGNQLATGIDGVAYSNVGNGLSNPNGLYQSGGGNQAYADAVDELGGVGYAVGWRTDVIFSFNSKIVDQIDIVHSWSEGDEYYREGDEDYSPVMADVQTAGVSARMYAWSDIGQALSAYLEENPTLTTRYDDPLIIGEDAEQFSAGITYYIGSLIASGTIEKKTAAYVSRISDNTLTVVNPGDVGSVSADVYAEGQNFDFIEGTFTLSQLMEEYDVDIIMLGASGYSYAGASGNSTTTTNKTAILTELVDLGYTEDTIPMVMDSSSIGVTIGSNGYNYAPTTPLFVPYVQAYAYMDELADVNEAINPMAMVMYMFDEFAHVKDDSVVDVSLYYIGTNWDAVDDTYDVVPDVENYVYDKDAIVEAIQIGAAYALSGAAEENGTVLMPAYSANETAYKLLTESATTEVPAADHEYITVTVNGVEKYLDLTDLIKSDEEEGDTGSTGGQYSNTRTSYEAIIDYYNSGEYGYGDNLQVTLQNYADHMQNHVWVPDTDVEGTYVYGVSGDDWGYDTLAVRRTANSTSKFYISYSNTSETADVTFTYGKTTDEILVGDWDGDGVDTIAVRRGNAYYFLNTAAEDLTDGGAYVADTVLYYGKDTDEVVVGDWDGDGCDTLCVRRGTDYYFSNDLTSSKGTQISIGDGSETALAGDWDGDGVDTICLGSGTSYTVYDASGATEYSYTFGSSKKNYDGVLAGDWNGDGVDTLCLRLSNVYYFTNSATGASTSRELTYGKATDEVFAGCWK